MPPVFWLGENLRCVLLVELMLKICFRQKHRKILLFNSKFLGERKGKHLDR